MDESKPPIAPSESRLRSASERIPADIASAKSDHHDAIERPESHSGQIETCGTDPSDGPPVAVYYRNAQEVSEGFLVALRAMGIADIETPEPAKPPVRSAKP
jgi:hypothetical protein